MTPTKHEKLAHLSDAQVERLVERYYEGVRNSELIREFGIDARPSNLHKLFPEQILPDLECPHCSINLWQRPRSKAGYSEVPPHCPQCNHIEASSCSCSGCVEERAARQQREEDIKRRSVTEAYSLPEPWTEPDIGRLLAQLTMQDVVYFLAFVQHGTGVERCFCELPDRPEKPMAPTPDLTCSIISRLFGRGLLAVDPNSGLDGFEFDDQGNCTAFYYFRVRYRVLPMLQDSLVVDVIRQIEKNARSGSWALGEPAGLNVANQIWIELALHECLEYFTFQAAEHSLSAPSGEGTILMFRSLLEDFSVAQIYSFVWRAARDAAAYYCRGGVSKRQAANTMVGKCRGQADRARVERWHVKPYRRNYNLPRSDLSLVFHDIFTGHGALGLETRVGQYQLTE